jgi:carbon storage regulator CsrA
MLILIRRIGETLILELPSGEWIDVILLEVKGSRGRLGIDAPLDVHIVREELLAVERPASIAIIQPIGRREMFPARTVPVARLGS